jgi:hypothetical protein
MTAVDYSEGTGSDRVLRVGMLVYRGGQIGSNQLQLLSDHRVREGHFRAVVEIDLKSDDWLRFEDVSVVADHAGHYYFN